jgi:hypothetical protein
MYVTHQEEQPRETLDFRNIGVSSHLCTNDLRRVHASFKRRALSFVQLTIL